MSQALPASCVALISRCADTLTPMNLDARRGTRLHLVWLAAIVFLFCWPLLVHGIPEASDDAILHAEWDKGFSKQLAACEWYPRWIEDENDGLGSPVFFYYGPIPSYASSPFGILLGARDPDGWRQAGFGCFLAALISAFGAYFWLRRRASSLAALFGAAIYAIAPYHLAVDLYVRGATGEFWGFAWMPLILLSVEALGQRAKWPLPALSLTYALLVMTHLPTVICFSPVVVAAGFFFAPRGRRIANALAAIGAMALGAGLAAIYLVPAMLDQWKINIGNLVSPIFDYRLQWFFRPPSWGLDFPERMALVSVATFAFIGVLFWLCLRSGIRGDERRAAIFYAGVAVFAFVFMSQLSAPVWRLIPYLRVIQFPWRFGMLPPLAAAMLAALAYAYLRERRARFAAICVAVIVAGWIGYTSWAAWPAIATIAGRTNSLVSDARSEIKVRPGPCEYLPVSAGLEANCSNKAEVRARALQNLMDGVPARSVYFPARYSEFVGGSAAVLDWKPRRVLLDVDAPVAGPITLRHFYYEGWIAHAADTNEVIPIGPSTPDGFMEMIVPQGRHEIVVELPTQPTEKAGRLITLICLTGLIAILIVAKLRTPPPASP